MKFYKIYFLPILIFLFCFHSGCSNLSDNPEIDIDLVNTELSEDEIHFINIITDYELDFYKTVFHSEFPEIKIKIFGDSLEYSEYQKKISSSRAKNGFYSSSKKLIIVNKNDRYLKTVSHEINHFILRHFIYDVPKWINEGLSEYFECAKLENGNIVIELQNKKLRRLATWIHEKDKIDFSDFFKWSNKKWREVNYNTNFYSSTISWGLIYFFMHDETNRYFLVELIRNIKNGADDYDLLEKLYPGGIKQLQYDFFVYIDLILANNSLS